MSDCFIGLMSGTSMDGIDAALVDFADEQPRLVAHCETPWPTQTLNKLKAAASGTPLSAGELAQLDTLTGELFAKAANQCRELAGNPQVSGIGSHGQTLAHAPDAPSAYSQQIGSGAVISERTGITTVNDFRSRDIAAGGQGAPLVPAFHAAVLSQPQTTRVILNIGGIANITVLAGDHNSQVMGFDTGPGNCLMDHWASRHSNRPYDKDGQMAASGTADKALLKRLLSDPYFDLSAPKSTGTDYFSADWLELKLSSEAASTADVQASLLALTAGSIADAIQKHAPDSAEVLVCGGGVHNNVLMQALQAALPCPVHSSATAGIDPDCMEAMAFAWLARETLAGRPGNLSSATGAQGPRILGAIHPA